MSANDNQITTTNVVRIDALRCSYCGAAGVPLSDDHVVPRSRGGPDDPSNLVKACTLCNSTKSDRLPSEWLEVVPAFVAAIEARVSARIEVKHRNRHRDKARAKAKVATAAKGGVAFPPCYFCGAPTSLTEKPGSYGFVEFFDQETAPFKAETSVRFMANGGREECGQFAWPGSGPMWVERGLWSGYEHVAIFTHQGCGPEGYWFDFKRVVDEHAHLEQHIHTSKSWACGIVREAFERVLRAAGVSWKPLAPHERHP